MRAGELRHRVTIQQATESKSVRGGIGTTFATLAVVDAAIESLGGNEALAARQQWAEVTSRIQIRYRSDVTAKHRVVYGTRIFDILAATDPDGRRRELDLLCAERNL